MFIKHNMAAMNSNRQLGLITGQLAETTEKLSSGNKINRAADDAAGLSISEKMRRQIRGLSQASDNIGDGISLCQVADGALNETTDILQRIRVLAVQSANGTYSGRDRQFIDQEVTQLKSEVDRIAKTTTFNDSIYPLNGPVADAGIPSGSYEDDGLIREITSTFTTDRACVYNGKQYQAGDTITIAGLTTNGTEIWISGGAAYTGIKWALSHTKYNELEALSKSDLKTDKDGYLYYLDKSGREMHAVYLFSAPTPPGSGNPDPFHFEDKAAASGTISSHQGRFMTIDDLGSPKPETGINVSPAQIDADIIIQAGADSGEYIPIQIVNATCQALGITDLTVATQESSSEALNLLNEAISKVTTYRSMFGVTQNRLEYAKKVDDNTAENTQAAESRVRDTDIASAMVMYANANILMQAGHSMLSQANQSRQDVSRLLESFV